MLIRAPQWVHFLIVFIVTFGFLSFFFLETEPLHRPFVPDPIFNEGPYVAQHDLTNIKFPVGPPDAALKAKMKRNGLDVRKLAVTLEMTDRPQALPVLLHFMSVLDDDWTFRVYHSEAIAHRFDSHHLRKHLESGKLTLIPVNIKFPSHPSVSDFLGRRTFWDALVPSEHILMFQFDSIMCSQSKSRVEDFFEYDFVGAPVNERFWQTWAAEFVMNGGFAYRKRSSLLRILEEYGELRDERNRKYLHEDQFFVDMLRLHGGKIPSLEVAKSFSVETVPGSAPLGVHKAATYLREGVEDAAPEVLFELQTGWCPEMNMLTTVIEQ